MAGPRHHLGLLKEALEGDRDGGRRLDQLFDRYLAPETGLFGEVHGAHAPATQLAFDPVLADISVGGWRRSRHQRRERGRRGRWRGNRDQAHSGRDVRVGHSRGRDRRGSSRVLLGCFWGGCFLRRRRPRRDWCWFRAGWRPRGLTRLGHLLARLAEYVQIRSSRKEPWPGYGVLAPFNR